MKKRWIVFLNLIFLLFLPTLSFANDFAMQTNPNSRGNLTITLPASPAAGVGNPQVTVIGMGTATQKVVAWGAQWLLTNLFAGSYTITAGNVDNGTVFFQAIPIIATVNAQSTTQINVIYTRAQSGRPASWNNIKHVVIIILENTNGSDALKQHFLKSLTTKGAYLAQSFAITHPSQPNYIALVAGSTLGVTGDGNVIVDALHLGDLLDAKGKTWKAYAEDLPSATCFLGATNANYARKHEPFISFKSVQNNPAQCNKIVPSGQFFTDLAANNLPTFSIYVPNQKNDGHDTGVAFADKWLQTTFGTIMSDPKVVQDTLFIVTFDEDNFTSVNQIYTALVGAAVKASAKSNVHYTHYSVLRTIEEIFQLGTLGKNDKTAPIISDVWQPN